jgi:hypothetical protein
MSKETGGQAFSANEMNGDGSLYMQHFGVTLRDYFAAAVLPIVYKESRGGPDWREDIADEAYKMADEMLKARAK